MNDCVNIEEFCSSKYFRKKMKAEDTLLDESNGLNKPASEKETNLN